MGWNDRTDDPVEDESIPYQSPDAEWTAEAKQAHEENRVQKLTALFLRYGNHLFDCAGGDGNRCQCGYSQAWESLQDVNKR